MKNLIIGKGLPTKLEYIEEVLIQESINVYWAVFTHTNLAEIQLSDRESFERGLDILRKLFNTEAVEGIRSIVGVEDEWKLLILF